VARIRRAAAHRALRSRLSALIASELRAPAAGARAARALGRRRRVRRCRALAARRSGGRIDAASRSLRRAGLVCFICWAAFAAAAIRLEGVALSAENHLRLAIALAGTAVALFAVARPGVWPRLLYLLSVGYLAYFAAGSAWYELWQVAAVPAEGTAQTLALTLELAVRMIAKEQRYGLALAQAWDLMLMPLAQVVTLVYLARAVLRR
jgi:hypothetical protein